jgi:uncharacterized protein YheU (UPF0270 family)
LKKALGLLKKLSKSFGSVEETVERDFVHVGKTVEQVSTDYGSVETTVEKWFSRLRKKLQTLVGSLKNCWNIFESVQKLFKTRWVI